MYIHSDMQQPIHFQIVVHSCLPTYNGYLQNRRRNVIDELIFIRMRGCELGNITNFIGVNSFVKSLKNGIYELNIRQGCKKIMLKSNRDKTQRYKVIIEKPTYAGDEMHSSNKIYVHEGGSQLMCYISSTRPLLCTFIPFEFVNMTK